MSTTTIAQEKRFCCYQSIMCEYATDLGYCKITSCAKLHELYETHKVSDTKMTKEERIKKFQKIKELINQLETLIDDPTNLYATPNSTYVQPLTEEIAIEFLQDSGWLAAHDKEIGNSSMKTGTWIEKKYIPYCSVCGKSAITLSNYCPNCGTKMKGGTINDET